MQSHVWGNSSQTVVVRVCSNHGMYEFDTEADCSGFQVRLERASGAGYWPGDKTEHSPQTVVTIQRVGSRPTMGDHPPRDRDGFETLPIGPALRLTADEGFDLLRALRRALKLALEQGMYLKPKGARSRLHEGHEDKKKLLGFVKNVEWENPYDRFRGDEAQAFDRLAQENRLAQAARSSETKSPIRGRATRQESESKRRGVKKGRPLSQTTALAKKGARGTTRVASKA